MWAKRYLPVLVLSLFCYFIQINFLAALFHPWLNLFLIVSLILIFKKSELWWPWLFFNLALVWLGWGGWWWLALGLTELFAWWLRGYFSGSERFWELSFFSLIVLTFFLIMLWLPALPAWLWPQSSWPLLAWGSRWLSYYLSNFFLLWLVYWLASFFHEKR